VRDVTYLSGSPQQRCVSKLEDDAWKELELTGSLALEKKCTI